MLPCDQKKTVWDAIAKYRSADGYEGDLVKAAEQLEQIGKDVWPILTGITKLPEFEIFVAAMVRMDGITVEDRRQALLVVAGNPDANVRKRLLELLEEIPKELQAEILQRINNTVQHEEWAVRQIDNISEGVVAEVNH